MENGMLKEEVDPFNDAPKFEVFIFCNCNPAGIAFILIFYYQLSWIWTFSSSGFMKWVVGMESNKQERLCVRFAFQTFN